MTKINDAYFHPGFRAGSHNNDRLVDWPAMAKEEKRRLVEWLYSATHDEDHEGRNKPSWLYLGLDVPSAETYRRNNIWHYHCGPNYYQPVDYQVTPSYLPHNDQGSTSPEVYHYAKCDDIIIVIGFSRSHEPFPRADSRSNPLRYRSNTLHETTFGNPAISRIPEPK